jgi:catechol 2,3-dioxygenase-like lactoylglutathione lyase family enzyme
VGVRAEAPVRKELAMRTLIVTLVVIVIAFALGQQLSAGQHQPVNEESKMVLGNFSVSLSVKDIRASKSFYEKLGFEEVSGNIDQNWIVLKNGTTKIGLFQGMFERNMLTFNPGWNDKKETLEDFTDVRTLQAQLEKAGIEMQARADPESTGPAHFMITDPDGNPILFDQHVPSPDDGGD